MKYANLVSSIRKLTMSILACGTLCGGSLYAEEAPPIPVRFTLDKPGVVTLVVDDADGNRVRNLISAESFPAGEHVIGWDGKDDLTSEQISGHPVHRHSGNPVQAGSYTVRGLVRDPVHLRYEMPLNTAGNPPWPTAEGNGAWMGDTLPPMAALALPGEKPMMLLGTGVTESYGIVWTDLEGQRINGIRSAGGGGGWWGAYLLARDNGPNADPNERVFLGGSWKNQMQIFALKIAPPFLDPSHGVRSMTVPHDMSHGRLIAQLDDTQQHPDFFSDPSRALLGGLAVHNRVVVAALTALDKLQVRGAQDGAVMAELALESPRGLAVTADGKLLVLSGNRLMRFDAYPPTGEPTVLVRNGLENPRQIALDADGNIYVSDRDLHQVKVFSPDGKPLRTIGEPGGPKLGPYDERRMAQPEGMAISPDGKLWVAENFLHPRRVSVWNLDGTFVKGLYGNGWYGGGGAIDPGDRTRAFVHGNSGGGMEFELDWEEGTSRLKSIYHLPGYPNVLPGMAQFAVRGGDNRLFLSNVYSINPQGGENVVSLWRMDNGTAVPAAALGAAAAWGLLAEERFISRLPEGAALNQCIFAWSDLNGDGQVQAEEVQFLRQGGGVFTLSADMTITTAHGVAFQPRSFIDGKVPVYDLAAGEKVFPDSTPSRTSGGGHVLDTGDGWAVSMPPTTSLKYGYLTGARDGLRRWHYPAVSTGVHGGYHSPRSFRPGELQGLTRLAGGVLRPKGTRETLWSAVSTQGRIHVLTSDGLFVASLFQDFRQGKSGPPTSERGTLLDATTLGQDCFFAALHQSEGGIYAVAGHDATFIVRVDGLESIRRLPEQQVTVTAEALDAVDSLGAITPQSHPKMPVSDAQNGNKQFHYRANIRAAKGAVDSISSGTFANHPPQMAHINGIYGQPTVYKFEMPGDVVALTASANYGNHAGPAYDYWIQYSLDGKTWQQVVKEHGNQGEFTITGEVDVPEPRRLVWVRFAGIGNTLVTLKAVDVKLVFQEHE